MARETTRRIPAKDVDAATAAMEELCLEAERPEQAARHAYEAQMTAAEREAHERRIREIDATAAELAAQEAAERRAHAEAVARSLRRP